MTPASPAEPGGARIHLLASVIVLALHVMFYQWLTGAGHSPREGTTSARELRIEFIEVVRRPDAVPPPEPGERPRPAVRPSGRQPAPPERAPAPAQSAPAAAVAADAPLVMEWDEPPVGPAEYRMNLPGRGEGDGDGLAASASPDLRLRRQVSGEDIVEGAAQLLGLWPPGYESDPCPRVKRNIAGLMTDTRAEGRALLSEELRRQRGACRE